MKNKINHIAIIPDGNRRWAKAAGLSAGFGHIEGSKRIEEIINSLETIGVPFLTIWGSSYDNFIKRSKTEVAVLEKIYQTLSKKILKEIEKNKLIKFKFIGEWKSLLKSPTVKLFEKVEEMSSENNKYLVTILIGYNGNREMLSAIQKLIKNKLDKIDDLHMADALWSNYLPPVDLVVRTGNDPHLSNGFMMWKAQNSYLHFDRRMWPDFRVDDLISVINKVETVEKKLGS